MIFSAFFSLIQQIRLMQSGSRFKIVLPVCRGQFLLHCLHKVCSRGKMSLPVTVQTALGSLKKIYPLVPFVKQQRSLEMKAPNLKSQIQILIAVHLF